MFGKVGTMERDLTDNASLRDLQEPVALYFSYVDADKYDFYLQNKEQLKEIQSTCRDELVEYLKESNYPAVSNISSLAAHPATIVVSTRGIQTPFLEPEDAKNFAKKLLEEINASKFAKPMSYVMAVHIEQLSMPVLHQQKVEGMFKYTRHPDGRLLDYIHQTYGPDFIQNKFKEAKTYSEDAEPLLKKKFDVFNMEEEIYSGRQLMLEAYTIHAYADMESRYLNYGTLAYSHAAHFVKDKAFIHRYGKASGQEYYDDYGIESGRSPEKDYKRQIETIVLPHKNEYKGVEIYMSGEKRRFAIPMEDEEWQVFAEYFRSAYIPGEETLKQRRINILREAKENGGKARTYMPVGYKGEELLLKEYEREKEPGMVELLPEGIGEKRANLFMGWLQSMKAKAHEIKGGKDEGGSDCANQASSLTSLSLAESQLKLQKIRNGKN